MNEHLKIENEQLILKSPLICMLHKELNMW